MPKMRMRPPEEDKEKLRQLRQDIKDMKLDMKETFAVMDEMPKPKKKRRVPWLLIAAAIIIGAAAAYILLFIVLPAVGV